MTELHPNLKAALGDLAVEFELHGVGETEAARILFGAAWASLRTRKPHARAMEHFQVWLDEIAANPPKALAE